MGKILGVPTPHPAEPGDADAQWGFHSVALTPTLSRMAGEGGFIRSASTHGSLAPEGGEGWGEGERCGDCQLTTDY